MQQVFKSTLPLLLLTAHAGDASLAGAHEVIGALLEIGLRQRRLRARTRRHRASSAARLQRRATRGSAGRRQPRSLCHSGARGWAAGARAGTITATEPELVQRAPRGSAKLGKHPALGIDLAGREWRLLLRLLHRLQKLVDAEVPRKVAEDGCLL